jgi:predicted nuclease of restriction endonuclease-like (RecB) superfamily
MLFERTALSKKPEKLIREGLDALRSHGKLTPDLVFRDPYFLEFLGLKDRYFEKDVEDAIMREMENFILELGAGFTFVARQKRIQVDNDDYYLDLLFYHRGLKRLVAIDLKLGDFKPADKGQMELYLKWLAKYEQKPDGDTPIGLTLCVGKKKETIELLELEKSGIHVASYWIKVLPRRLLQKKLHEAIQHARSRLAQTGSLNGKKLLTE